MTACTDPVGGERRLAQPGRPTSIRRQLSWLVAACVVPVWIVAGILVHHAYRAKRTQISGHLLEMARSLSMSVDRELAGAQAALMGLATSPSFEAGDLAAVHRQARMLLSSYPGADIIVADAGGQQLVNSHLPFGAPLPRRNTPETVRRIFRSGRPVVSDLYYGAVTGRPLVAIDVPVTRGGRVLYDLSMTFPPGPMATILFQRRFSEDQRFAVVLDSRGVVVARSRERERLVGRRACPELLGAVAAFREGGTEAVNLEGKRVINAFSRSALSGWVVVIGVPAATVQAEMQRWLGWALAGTLFLSLAGVALAWTFGRTIARSVRSLVVPAEVLGRGEPLDALVPTGLEEADAVGEALAHASRLLREHRTERDRAEHELREYARRLMDVEETLRKNIAAELHDETGRDLTVLGINLSIMADSLPPGASAQLVARVGDSVRLVENISRTVRSIMATLRPPVLDDYGLAAALSWYGQLFYRRTAIRVSLRVDDDFPRLNGEREIVLFRIAQEALTNVAKYSGARQVVMTLGRAAGRLRFSVADDGGGLVRGAIPPADASGWGVMIMRERAELIGGVLRIESSPGQGVAVVVDFPEEDG